MAGPCVYWMRPRRWTGRISERTHPYQRDLRATPQQRNFRAEIPVNLVTIPTSFHSVKSTILDPTHPMKTIPWPSLCLTALVAAGFCPRLHANLFTDSFEATIVAERAKDAPPEPKGPVAYVAFDGGFIEAGDPIAGDTPPSADQVRQELRTALAAQGYQVAQNTPSLVLAYYWGILRRDREQIRVPFGIKTNLRARIALISTEQLRAEVDNFILGREKGSNVDMNASSPTLLTGPVETVIQNARFARIFIVVSAYDYQALAERHEAKLVWRTKLSAQESSGEMIEVIPPLISVGGPYFGKNSPEVRILTTTLSKAPAVTGTGEANAEPSPGSYNLDDKFIRGLLKAERISVSGMSD